MEVESSCGRCRQKAQIYLIHHAYGSLLCLRWKMGYRSTTMRYHTRRAYILPGVCCYVSLQPRELSCEGDQKFVPDLNAETLRKIVTISSKAQVGLGKIITPLLAIPPFNLGYPSKNAQSSYDTGTELISPEEIANVSETMQTNSITY